MKIGMLLPRATEQKSMGPLAEEALGAGHRVQLLYFGSVESQSKSYLGVRPEMLAALTGKGAAAAKIKRDELDTLQENYGIDALVVQEGYYHFKNQLRDLRRLRRRGVKLISLSHFFEITKQPLEALDHFDQTLYTSEYARDLHFKLRLPRDQIEAEQENRSLQFGVTGSPMFDQIGRTARKQARRELGLPPEGRVVLLVAPVIDTTTPWRHHVWRDESRLGRTRDALKAGEGQFIWEIWTGHTFRRVFKALADFCRRHGAQLLVKSRGKQVDLDFIVNGAARYFDGLDDSYYPQFTTYKLIAASDLCVTVNSMAAVEAVAAGRPCVNIYVPHMDFAVPKSPLLSAYMNELLDGRPGSLMNYEGALLKVDRRGAVNWFANAAWGEAAFQPSRGSEYAEQFLGIGERRASRRVLERIVR